jgi:hypothetical protein
MAAHVGIRRPVSISGVDPASCGCLATPPMGVLAPELVKAHLNLDDVIAGLPRSKPGVVA